MSERTKINLTFYLSIFTIIILFLIIEYSLISREFFSLSADESGHTLEAHEWYKGEGQLFSIWLPFFKVINGIALKLHYDLILTPRLVSVLFGLLTLLSIIFLTHQLFDNRITSILTGFLAALFLPITVFSVLPLIEIYFFFFVTASLGFYFLWLKSEKNIHLWATALLTAIGTSTRYEAWIFALFIFSFIVMQLIKSPKTFAQKVLLCAVIGFAIAFFPLLWIYLSYLSTQDAHGFVSSVANRYNEGKAFAEIKNNALYQFVAINFASLNIIGLAPLIYLIKNERRIKNYFIILLGTLLIFSILSFAVKAMPTHNHWRIAAIWCLLLLPFTGYWLSNLIETAKTNPLNKYLFFIFFILIIYFFNSQTFKYSASSYLTMDDINVGKYLNEILKIEDAKVFIIRDGSDKWRYANILVTSQHPDYCLTDLASYTYVSTDTLNIDQRLISEMSKHNAKFLVIPSRTTISNSEQNFIEQKSFIRWKIYKLKS